MDVFTFNPFYTAEMKKINYLIKIQYRTQKNENRTQSLRNG